MLFLLYGIASIRGLIAKLGFNSQIEIFLGHAPINSTTQKIHIAQFTVPYFSVRSLCSTGRHLGLLMREEYKLPVGRNAGVNSVEKEGPKNSKFSTRRALYHHHISPLVSPVSLALRDQDCSPSNSTIDIYDFTEK